MITTRVFQPRAQRFAAACTVTAAALVGAAACSAAPAHNPGSASGGTHNNAAFAPPAPGTTAPTASATASAAATQSPAAPATGAANTGAAQSQPFAPAQIVPACQNADIQVGSGYGTQSFPKQWAAVVFKNVGDHTCTLQGFPGAAIEVDGTVINATRVLDIDPDGQGPSRAPLVTIAPGSTGYALMYWLASNAGETNCYPTGTGTMLTTPPDTTATVTFSTAAHVGSPGICSDFEISPVEPGNWGVPIDTPVDG
jgi:hypothetical protein